MRTIAWAMIVAVAGSALAGCVVREQTTVVERRPMYEQPVQTEVVAEPVIVDYATVAPPAVITEYISINGGFYYYHPDRHVFVRLAGPPPRGAAIRTITSWNEHPMYAQVQHVAPPPRAVVVTPAPRRVRSTEVTTTVVAAPVIVEANTVVAPRSVSEYVLMDGKYYYYHPDRKVFVHVAAPARGVAVREIHAWNEHPDYDKVEHVTVHH